MSTDLLQLFKERERVIFEGKNFLDSRQDSAGNVSKADADYFEEHFGRVKNAMDYEIEKEMSRPTTQPILNNPQDNIFGSSNTKARFGIASENYRNNFFDEVRGGFKTAYNTLREGSGSQGGYFLPLEMHDEIISELKDENILRQIGRVIQTANDREICIQSTAPSADFYAESASFNLSNETFEKKTLKAYKLVSGVSVSNELLQDSFYDIESHLQIEFGKSIATVEENAFLNGTGSGEPTGLLTTLAADTDSLVVSSGTAIVSADDLINLAYSVKRPYRKNACWLMNDTTLATVRKLKDDNGNFIWERNFSLSEPPTILGFPVYTSEYMPSIASGNIPVIFGDFSKYIIGQRGNLIFKPLYELHALQDLTSYLMIERVDAVLSDKFAMKGLKVS